MVPGLYAIGNAICLTLLYGLDVTCAQGRLWHLLLQTKRRPVKTILMDALMQLMWHCENEPVALLSRMPKIPLDLNMLIDYTARYGNGRCDDIDTLWKEDEDSFTPLKWPSFFVIFPIAFVLSAWYWALTIASVMKNAPLLEHEPWYNVALFAVC